MINNHFITIGCSTVTVSGSSHQQGREGDYIRMEGLRCGNHASYNQISGNNYLFYVDEIDGWMVGPKHCDNYGGIDGKWLDLYTLLVDTV